MTNEIKVGDIITAYHKGIHIVTSIERRYYKEDGTSIYGPYKKGDEYNPLIKYRTVVRFDGSLLKSKKIKECDSAFCKPVKKYIEKESNRIETIKRQIQTISSIG